MKKLICFIFIIIICTIAFSANVETTADIEWNMGSYMITESWVCFYADGILEMNHQICVDINNL